MWATSASVVEVRLIAAHGCSWLQGTLSEKDVGISVADVWHRALKVNYSAYGQAILDWHQKIAYEQDWLLDCVVRASLPES